MWPRHKHFCVTAIGRNQLTQLFSDSSGLWLGLQSFPTLLRFHLWCLSFSLALHLGSDESQGWENPRMVCRILEARCRGEGGSVGPWKRWAGRGRPGVLPLAGTGPRWPWMAVQPQSGVRPVGFHLGETNGLSRRGRSQKAHLCHGAALGGSVSQTDAGFASLSRTRRKSQTRNLRVSCCR